MTAFSDFDREMMSLALEKAAMAAAQGEVPVGAVVVMDGKVVATAGNGQIGDCDPTAHAEILALRDAARAIRNYRLAGATLYATLEPCTMCCGALVHARIGRLVYGALEPKAGAVVSTGAALDNPALNHRVTHAGGLLADESAMQLSRFFRGRRRGLTTRRAPGD
ncbi:tRNA-specific adenosine deaminase [Luminiphilus syltensis NOR5-1B]|uniref:tRNA-specific adenosine deaminase n=2 Tax=Luminiphilus TaxID=1341118 RepID=B8KXG3_9GAMM|nr:tRNA-specific adenosine deaminase [Luminiphilus syltensis NOR5-1B]